MEWLTVVSLVIGLVSLALQVPNIPRVQAWWRRRRDRGADLDERRRRLSRGSVTLFLREPTLLDIRLTAATARLLTGVGAIGVLLSLMLVIMWQGADATGNIRSLAGLALSLCSIVISGVFMVSAGAVTKAFRQLAAFTDARLELAEAAAADLEARLAAARAEDDGAQISPP